MSSLPNLSERAASNLLAAEFDILLARGMPQAWQAYTAPNGWQRSYLLAELVTASTHIIGARYRPARSKAPPCSWYKGVRFMPGGAIIKQFRLRWAGPQDHTSAIRAPIPGHRSGVASGAPSGATGDCKLSLRTLAYRPAGLARTALDPLRLICIMMPRSPPVRGKRNALLATRPALPCPGGRRR